jgi:hypothetical protein
VAHVPGSTEMCRGRENDGSRVAQSQDGVAAVVMLGALDGGGLDSGDRR